MSSKLLSKLQSHKTLERAWRVIEENARTSRSVPVREEVEKFQENQSTGIRSISSRLSKGTFKFEAAMGIPIDKSGKKKGSGPRKIRPIVLAPLKSRIVQRAIHDVLVSLPAVRAFMLTPHSFGGIGKEEDDELAAVPAAIQAVLDSIAGGARFVAYADISEFFTRIPKRAVSQIVAGAVNDENFMHIFDQAITVELANLASLKEHASKFPTHEIGVAQGNSLSPLLGNLLLYDFDASMNKGDCRCIRYIDDFIILAPTARAAQARLKKASALLEKFNMSLSAAKSSKEPIPANSSIEFLGIEINNGLLRPTKKAQASITDDVRSVFALSTKAILSYRGDTSFDKSCSLLTTLRRIDSILQGWGKHYRFCNDTDVFRNIDSVVSEEISKYLGVYSNTKKRSPSEAKRHLLGVQLLSAIELSPLKWGK